MITRSGSIIVECKIEISMKSNLISWFNSHEERTERYVLYEIPFLKERCKSVKIFESKESVKEFLEPFKKKQQTLKNLDSQ